MNDFPKSTVFNQWLTKEKLSKSIKTSKEEDELLTTEIKKITWANKFSKTTLNIEAGETDKEIQVFEIILKQQSISEKLIKYLNKIPYPIVYILKYEQLGQLAIYYKKLYTTKWIDYNELNLEIKGLTLDEVLDNFIIQIGEIEVESGIALSEQVELNEEQLKLENKIKKL